MNDEMSKGLPDHYYFGVIKRIEQSFGKSYEPEMNRAIIKLIKRVKFEWLNDVVEILLEKNKYFPKVPDWVVAVGQVLRENQPKGFVEGCPICKGSVWVMVGKVDDALYNKCMRCGCKKNQENYRNVSGVREDIGFWDKELFQKGYYLTEPHNWHLNPVAVRKKFNLY